MIRFLKKRITDTSSTQPKPQPAGRNEIIIHEQDTICLSTMVLSDSRKGNFFIQGDAIVEKNSFITGTIVSANAIIGGRVDGEIICTGEVVLAASSIVEGNVKASTVVISPQAIFNGDLVVSGQTSTTAESRLSEKINLAQQLLNKGYVPEVEILKEPDPPQNEITTFTKKTEKKNKHSQKGDENASPSGDTISSWW
ncbi:polymer-forming cytoskeletal protein [Sphingobacterium sp. DN00404]|uniref:Polymer-forming cytoskeletal protein n=1 Tax=Sphingobacterium micropteri TaxID=2763501 RepID=A0ABR7YND3_9SPHI|nr:polymer-forming cytoskeletal protein [Sphingobacterium micropteri]MBD1432849.1 polymer-forming cytoskeletal protein [Sphingobacterium micropteri]